MSSEFEQEEYFFVANTVGEFDKRLLTVKGWGVSLSLVAMGLGFEHRSYGFFLVAAISSAAFWAVEAVVKRHQMRHYVRMREIEVSRYQQSEPEKREYSAPRADWSWYRARSILKDKSQGLRDPLVLRGKNGWYSVAFLMPHVAFPHAITLAASLILFLMGLNGCLSDFALGALKN